MPSCPSQVLVAWAAYEWTGVVSSHPEELLLFSSFLQEYPNMIPSHLVLCMAVNVISEL